MSNDMLTRGQDVRRRGKRQGLRQAEKQNGQVLHQLLLTHCGLPPENVKLRSSKSVREAEQYHDVRFGHAHRVVSCPESTPANLGVDFSPDRPCTA